jgi:hypothetical protein
MTDVDRPEEGVPPRAVQAWTSVRGHTIAGTQGRYVCSCGEWRAETDSGSEAEAQRMEHLRNAWPVMVPREPGERRDSWRERIAAAHDEALQERHRLEARDHLLEPTREGQPFPIISREFSAADERVTVLEWWLDKLADPRAFDT